MLDDAELDAEDDPVPAPTDDADDNIMSDLAFTISCTTNGGLEFTDHPFESMAV